MNKYTKGHRPDSLYEFRGQLLPAHAIAEILGTKVTTVCKRIRAGSQLDKPVRPKRPSEERGPCVPMPMEEVIAGLVARSKDPEAHETLETLLHAAYVAGAARPRDTRADLEG